MCVPGSVDVYLTVCVPGSGAVYCTVCVPGSGYPTCVQNRWGGRSTFGQCPKVSGFFSRDGFPKCKLFLQGAIFEVFFTDGDLSCSCQLWGGARHSPGDS